MTQARPLSDDQAIERMYRAMTARSAEHAVTAKALLPSGVVHDSRYMQPYSIYVDSAAGAHKWDVDGNRYVDYFGGHGSLILGHNHPEVVAAVETALRRGTHFAANHVHELDWARQVVELVPSAEKVRFTSSGTEAVGMALRLARAHTGRSRIARFRGHFHGWADDQVTGYQSHFNGGAPSGVPGEVASNVVLLDVGSVDALRATLRKTPDIAAVIVEPLGAATGMVPIAPSYLEALREITAEQGQLLTFDEVITGFRVSPGGVQAAIGVTPDLTVLAKILAGGLPGGAVAGRAEILDWLDHEACRREEREKIYHPGTYNGNPVSAAAGAATLSIIGRGGVCEAANEVGHALREGFAAVVAKENIAWGVYGRYSALHICMNPALDIDPLAFRPEDFSREELQAKPPELVRKLRMAMLVNGVDLSSWPGGLTSAAHSGEDIAATLEAFGESLRMLKREGLV